MYRFISDEDQIKLRAVEISRMAPVNVGKGILDEFNQEINIILDNYSSDYSDGAYDGCTL